MWRKCPLNQGHFYTVSVRQACSCVIVIRVAKPPNVVCGKALQGFHSRDVLWRDLKNRAVFVVLDSSDRVYLKIHHAVFLLDCYFQVQYTPSHHVRVNMEKEKALQNCKTKIARLLVIPFQRDLNFNQILFRVIFIPRPTVYDLTGCTFHSILAVLLQPFRKS